MNLQILHYVLKFLVCSKRLYKLEFGHLGRLETNCGCWFYLSRGFRPGGAYGLQVFLSVRFWLLLKSDYNVLVKWILKGCGRLIT